VFFDEIQLVEVLIRVAFVQKSQALDFCL
jgi:hypothetical protein